MSVLQTKCISFHADKTCFFVGGVGGGGGESICDDIILKMLLDNYHMLALDNYVYYSAVTHVICILFRKAHILLATFYGIKCIYCFMKSHNNISMPGGKCLH